MSFCTNCGGQVGGESRFCPNCGAPLGAAAAAPAPLVVAEPLEYSIHGDNLQVARIRLKAGQEIYAEAGKMVYKTTNIAFVKRIGAGFLGGEGLFLATLTGPGRRGRWNWRRAARRRARTASGCTSRCVTPAPG
jgi:hypothetical protein